MFVICFFGVLNRDERLQMVGFYREGVTSHMGPNAYGGCEIR